MIQSHNYLKISYILMGIDILSIGCIVLYFFTDKTILFIIGIIINICIITILIILSNTLIIKLSNALQEEISKPPIIEYKYKMLDNNSIKEIGLACNKLDKYGISYQIDYDKKKVIAEVSMGLYTRMAVANNLSEVVLYHIIGTNKCLIFNKKE